MLDETEMEQLADLVEYRLSRLHFAPPRFPWRSPAQLLAAHPLFQELDDGEFRQEVGRPPSDVQPRSTVSTTTVWATV